MKKKKRVLITGTVLWYVIEHLYYVPGRAGPLQEYCVSCGILTGYYDGPRYTEFCIRGYEPGKILARQLKDRKAAGQEKIDIDEAIELILTVAL